MHHVEKFILTSSDIQYLLLFGSLRLGSKVEISWAGFDTSFSKDIRLCNKINGDPQSGWSPYEINVDKVKDSQDGTSESSEVKP